MGAIDNVREVGDLIRKFNDIELNRKILTLETEVIDLTRSNRQLESKVEELNALIELKQKLVHRPPFHWLDGDPHPYCTPCWEDRRKAIHVILYSDNSQTTRWDCPTCKQEYFIEKEGASRQRQVRPRPFGGGPDAWMAR